MLISLECEIILSYHDNRLLRAIDKALRPDNITPGTKDITIKQELKDGILLLKIVARSVGTLKNTIDDILKTAIVAEKSLRRVRGIML